MEPASRQRIRIVMPTPLDQLREEHDLARRALGVLKRVAEHVACGDPFPTTDTATLLRFFHEFVEGVHHAKEADHLFPALALHSDDTVAEAVGLLFGEHDDTRGLLHSLMMFWEPVDDLVPAERDGFAQTARTYAQRLDRHMEIEEQALFGPARHSIPADDRITLMERFEELDRERRGARYWRPIVAELETRWSA